MSTVELDTLSPKKWIDNYGGLAPTLDSSGGIKNGDFAIDSSTTPNKVWICIKNTAGSPIWEPDNRYTVTTVSNTYSATTYDRVILSNSSSGIFTINLPAVSGNTGVVIHIKKIDASANSIEINANGSELIDGELIQYINTQYDCMTIVCDGSGWDII